MLKLPSVQKITTQFHYDPATGVFKDAYPKKGRKRADGTAGSTGPNKYIYLRILGRRYLAQRVAWKIMTGEDPVVEVDHKDNVRSNNKWANLRLANDAEQSWNTSRTKRNTSGFKGITWIAKKRYWVAYIRVYGRRIYLGSSKDPKEAHALYVAAAQHHFGEFANAG